MLWNLNLRIAGPDRTHLVDGLSRQVAAVEAVLADIAPDVPVTVAFLLRSARACSPISGLPLVRTSRSTFTRSFIRARWPGA